MDNSIQEQLQAPFPTDCVAWRVGSTTKDKTKGLALAYLTNRAIMDRLDEVFGVMGWQNQFREWKGTSQICGISIWDDVKSEWVTKWDGADDSLTEAVKGGLSDSMKRCGYQWGIGRYLYKLPQTWVPLKNGKYLAETPKLPTWALPKEPVLKTISKEQQKALFAIAGTNTAVAKEVLLKHKYTNSDKIKKVEYEAICQEIKKAVE